MFIKVAVLGGTGFIGEYLNRKLSKLAQVRTKVIFKNDLPRQKLPRTIYTHIDSSQIVLADSDCLVILTQPNIKLIENILRHTKPKKIIYASTLLLYGDSEKPQDENSPIFPVNDYEKGKSEEETILINLLKNSNIKLTIARLANVYGDLKNRGIIQKIFNAIFNDQPLSVNNNGRQKRDYIFVEDVANYLAFLVLHEQIMKVEKYNIATGIGTSVSQLIDKIEGLTQKKIIRENGSNLLEKKSIIGDNKKIVDLSGFKPKFDLESGLKKTYQNLLKY